MTDAEDGDVAAGVTVNLTEGRVAEVALDIPRTRNALSVHAVTELTVAIDRLSTARTARVIVLTGAGLGFSSGADLKERVSPEETVRAVGGLYDAILNAPMPVIARVEGYCLGLAVGVVAACDLVVAEESTTFALPEARFGQAPTLAAVTLLRRVTAAEAGRMMLTAEPFDGRHARAVGLADASVPHDQLAATVARWTDSMRAGAPGALSACKRLVHELPELDPADGWALAHDLTRERAASKEAQEGSAAEAERRAPAWQVDLARRGAGRA